MSRNRIDPSAKNGLILTPTRPSNPRFVMDLAQFLTFLKVR